METLCSEGRRGGRLIRLSLTSSLLDELRSWGLFPTKISHEVGGKPFIPPSGGELAISEKGFSRGGREKS
jgi:hypothetical protein